MREITGIRRFEWWFAGGATLIYVIRRLLEEANRIDRMIGEVEQNRVPAATIWRDLAGFNHIINNNFPLIVGALLFLAAWYVFHFLTLPNWNSKEDDEKIRLYACLSVLLVVSSVAFYYFSKLQVHYRQNEAGTTIGLKVYSLYRKRNVLADAIGMGIFIVGYELLCQLGYYLNRKSRQDFRFISYLVWVPLYTFLAVFVLAGNLPEMLWRSPVYEILLTLAVLIQVYVLQAYIYTSLLPNIRSFRTTEFQGRLLAGLLIWMLLSAMLWGARTYFRFPHSGLNNTLSILTLFCAVIIALLRRTSVKEKVALQTQVSHTSAELAGLQSQINPHFLFNALNSLYATALKENSEKTADGIQKLGDMMRFMLQENNRDRISLEKEVEYLRNYIELQRMRLDESHGIEIRVTIQEPNRDVSIAPMMLIPFVENAFKHGISLRKPSWIFVTLTLDQATIYFKVHNSRHPGLVDDPEREHTGIGLENVSKRLELIYPGRHTLAIQASEQDYFVALTIRY